MELWFWSLGVGNTSECMQVRMALILIPSIGTTDLQATGPNRIFGGWFCYHRSLSQNILPPP